jgi:hypothetical protein
MSAVAFLQYEKSAPAYDGPTANGAIMKRLARGLLLMAIVTPSLHATSEVFTMSEARGTFDVKVIPQAADDPAGGPFGRLFLDKQFHGDLEGGSKGQMLASGTGKDGSGAYVALELISGTLNGRRGSFVLQHNGTMTKGVPNLIVTVVPDSGTDELTGLAGTMTIVIAEGKHSYVFAYTLDGARP